jgi:tRNA-specific 2-thiouridylase
MTGNVSRVLVAISGGVDSSTAAALLVEGGRECTGVFMITNGHYQHAREAAEAVAKKLGIELHVLDLREEFERILDYFCSEYRKGRTPNPCVVCNRQIKFGRLWEFARGNGADCLATGHYARIVSGQGGSALYEAADSAKDQSYALAMVKRELLEHIILPMGSHSKSRTRELAAEFGLGTQGSDESQEICFIPDDDYVAVVEKRCSDCVRGGRIIDGTGKVLGEHRGVHRFTIGQRRGLGMAMGKPYYVVKIDAESNTITLGPKEQVMHRMLSASDVNWLVDGPTGAFRAKVKIRYNDNGSAATVTPQDGGAVVVFDEPNAAITPGQLAAFYVEDENGSRVIGGGWIEKSGD